MPKLIGPELQCSQVSYFLQKGSDTTNSGGPILYGLFRSLEYTRLTAIKSAFGLDIIQSTHLCQNKFGPRKSNLQRLLFLKNPIDYVFFWIHKLCNVYNQDCLSVVTNN